VTLREDQIRLLEAFADGRLEGAERSEAERLVDASEPAASLVAELREADDLVRGYFPVPAEFGPCRTEAFRLPAPRPHARRLRWALAAGLLLAAFGAYVTNFVLVTSPDSLRREFIAAGFVPSWKCTDDDEFVNFSTSRVGEAFLVAGSGAVSVLGWDSGHELLSEDTLSLWAMAGDVPVVVFIDQLGDDRLPRLRPLSGMNLHRGQLGGTVFYEVSPLDAPVVLPLIHRPGEAPGQVQSEACEGPPFTPRQYPTPAPPK